jgi:hypothetical protein
MIKIYLKNKLFIKLSQLEKQQRDKIIQSYRFSYSDYCPFNKAYVIKNLNLFEVIEDKPLAPIISFKVAEG